MTDPLSDMDSREVYDANPYDLTDDETIGQDSIREDLNCLERAEICKCGHRRDDHIGLGCMIPSAHPRAGENFCPCDEFQPAKCDWCSGPLDSNGLCLARCRAWRHDNSGHGHEPEPCCAWCGSRDIDIRDYDYGIDPDCGYHDAGTMAVCLNCGRSDEL